MKRRLSILASGAGVLALGIALLIPYTPSWSEGGEPDEYTTVTGTVQVAEEDENGVPTRVYIETEEFDFLVAPEGAGQKLLDHVEDWVEATGRAFDSEDKGDFDYILYVESFTVLDED